MDFDYFVRHARRHFEMTSAEYQQRLAAGQRPSALFITCSDSRIVPARITGAQPGELFELRTAGNVVPPYAPDSASGEMATIEYAVLVLRVPHIVVCGHSHCGAITALTTAGAGLDELPALRSWLSTDRNTGSQGHGGTPPDPGVRQESKRHLRAQLEALRTYPFVARRVDTGQLTLHGWFYEIDTGLVFVRGTGESTEDFLPL